MAWQLTKDAQSVSICTSWGVAYRASGRTVVNTEHRSRLFTGVFDATGETDTRQCLGVSLFCLPCRPPDLTSKDVQISNCFGVVRRKGGHYETLGFTLSHVAALAVAWPSCAERCYADSADGGECFAMERLNRAQKTLVTICIPNRSR